MIAWESLAPTGFARCKLEYPPKARVRDERAPVLERLAPRGPCELINEALDDECVMRTPDRPERPDRWPQMGNVELDPCVRYLVVTDRGSGVCGGIDAIALFFFGKGSTDEDRLTDQPVAPRNWLAFCVQT